METPEMHTFIPLLFRTSFAYATKNLSRFQHRTHSGVAAKPPFATKKRALEHMQHFYFPGCMYQVWKSLCVLIHDETINIAFTSVAPLFCNNHQFIFNPYFVCYQKLGHFYFSQSPWLFLFAWWFWSLLLSIALARIGRVSSHCVFGARRVLCL